MPSLIPVVGGARAVLDGEFEFAFLDPAGAEQQLPLTEVWSVPFEVCLPVRRFSSYKGQRHHAGRWWTATTGAFVGYKS